MLHLRSLIKVKEKLLRFFVTETITTNIIVRFLYLPLLSFNRTFSILCRFTLRPPSLSFHLERCSELHLSQNIAESFPFIYQLNSIQLNYQLSLLLFSPAYTTVNTFLKCLRVSLYLQSSLHIFISSIVPLLASPQHLC